MHSGISLQSNDENEDIFSKGEVTAVETTTIFLPVGSVIIVGATICPIETRILVVLEIYFVLFCCIIARFDTI